MKKFSVILFSVLLSVIVFGCNKTVNTEPKKVTYDRDLCERCKMQLVDRYHSAQIVNPEDGKSYPFDDLGCAVLWLDETTPAWKDKALIYITDGKDGSWVEHKNAYYAEGYNTPMSFGIAAFNSKDKLDEGKTLITYEQARDIIRNIKIQRSHNKNGSMQN